MCRDKIELSSVLARCFISVRLVRFYGGIAQLARASGSYPAGRRFKSHYRYHNGPLVKRLRHRPFTAATRVRFS